jgi:C1A family cysteine protease
MKVILFTFLFVGIAFASQQFDENEAEFEEEFGVKFPIGDLEEQEKEAGALEEAEKEINDNNEKFDNGESTFEEKLYPESNLPKPDFEKEKEGLTMPEEAAARSFTRSFGLIMPPEAERNNPENAAALAREYARIAANRDTEPSEYSAVSAGIVTDPKNQGSCGSCAAFGATAIHETCMVKSGVSITDLDLSEQYLLDCGYNGGSMGGCNGASPHAYQVWFSENGGLAPHENTYPYGEAVGTCDTSKAVYDAGAKVSNVVYDYSCSHDTLKGLVAAHGAVTVGIYASDSSFGNYASGIYQGCSSTNKNHAVTVVGYGTEDDVDYWLVKNSWGTYWGDGGYIKMKRGSNECGIEDVCIYTECSTTTGSDEAPTTTTTTAAPSASCDVSNWFGELTGTYYLRVRISGVLYDSFVSCVAGVCTPEEDGVVNACEYICGMTTCGT